MARESSRAQSHTCQITGTFDKPKFSADMQALGKDQLFKALEDDDPTQPRAR